MLREDEPRLARRYLAQAIARQPVDDQNWQQLSLVYLVLGRDGDALTAARRSLALDPMGAVPATVVQHTELAQAPPAASATAAATPSAAADAPRYRCREASASSRSASSRASASAAWRMTSI